MMKIPTVANDEADETLKTKEAILKDEQAFTFTPQQAHVFGGQSIFLSFMNLDMPFGGGSFYYVVFHGSKLRHITSAKILNPYTLQAVIPDHDQAELVTMTVCQLTEESHEELGKGSFIFTSDSSEFLAQQLVTNALDPKALKHLENVYKSILNVSLSEKRALDTRLTTSFRNLTSGDSWEAASDDTGTDSSDDAWNLLHFCAKYSLVQLAELIASLPGAKIALQSMDDQGQTPFDIAVQNDHKKLMEVLSRVPCDVTAHAIGQDTKRPNVKRHKLGTTTISNITTDSTDDIEKDLMLLKEVDELASVSDGSVKMNGVISGHSNEEISPLSESLKKLQEINEEIRRLRSLSYKENIDQYEKEMNGDASSGFFTENNNGVKEEEDDDFVDIGLSEANNNIDITCDKLSTIPPSQTDDSTEKSIESTPDSNQEETSTEVAEEASTEVAEEASSSVDVASVDASVSDAKQPEIVEERKLSCVSVELEEVSLCEAVEELAAIEEVVPTVTEINVFDATSPTSVKTPDEDVALDANSLMPGDLNFGLESVTEETEEELNAVGSGRSPLIKRQNKSAGEALAAQAQTQSLTDLPPLPPKRVGILKRSGAKRDRPLSDSYENLKMVENQGIVDLFQRQAVTPKTPPTLVRGHSLDALMNDEEDGRSRSTSQNSLSVDHDDSQESLSASDLDSPKSRSRSGSDKTSSFSQRASSLSLNEIYFSRTSSTSSTEDLTKLSKKSGHSLFSRFHGKKAKSMSSLDTEERTLSEEERRKTIAGDMNMMVSGKRNNSESKDNLDEITHQDMYGDILVQLVGPSSEVKKSQSTISIDKCGKDGEKDQARYRRVSTSALPHSYGRRMFTNSDDNTDDEIGTENNEKHPVERKTSGEDKSKRRFGLLRSKPKDKKSSKDKDKHHLRERKDSDSKKKKAPSSKAEVAATVKLESKSTGFLTKRGSSFRQNFNKTPAEIKDSQKQMFMRGSNSSTSVSGNKLRSSDRRSSPVVSRKVSSTNDLMTESNFDIDAQSLLQTRNLSSSRTSIDSDSYLEQSDDTDYSTFTNNSYDDQEYDSDLDAPDVPETWSELVDTKVRRKMHAKDIKRQDVIYELIQTEAQYVRNLYVMKKIYMKTMEQLNLDQRTIETIFPELNELIDLNGGFLKALRERQESSPNYCIEIVGDILREFFGGEKGERLKAAYGKFCSKHLSAVSKHKEYLKLDKRFAACMKKCLLNVRSRRLTLPECITYVTIRMTKYPLLIEAIIKATKESKPDYDDLKTSLRLVKDVLVAVDDAVNEYEQRKELEILKKNLDRKNVVEIKNGQTKVVYRANKLFHRRSKLLCDKKTVLREKKKSFETRMVVLAEKIIFFQDNGAKLQLLQAENKAPVLSLKNLMVREVATDSKALFLVSTSKDAAQIYDIVCDSYKDKKEYMAKLKNYIKDCPDEEEEITDNEEEAKREEEERMQKLKELIGYLQSADENIYRTFSDKNRIVAEMREVIESLDECGQLKAASPIELKTADVTSARDVLEQCLVEVNHLSFSPQNSVDAPSPSPSPTPLQSSSSSISLPGARRTDTFNSFDSRIKPSSSSGSVNRSVSSKPALGRPNLTFTETTDSGKPRRQSQLLTSMLGRSKTMGSQEDLSSLSSSSIATLAATVSQLHVFQSLRENLNGLVEVTNKQDTEIAKMRLELQESRNEVAKLRLDKKELEDRLVTEKKESDRTIRAEKDSYAKLQREFKRTTDKLNRQLDEKRMQYQTLLETYSAARANSDEAVYL